ncbi:glycosyltransferase family 2 protein [Mucilaginibacter sp. KACC 22063]|uniref:glycosyltransferase family 2 protein n=1 Tax=Mucilaginibacter sp. KACC 22063 TaxID=3025666 RepID=UPI00236719E2|nr:glycosyltransferase family 2 protein [Mucilaginibacter sp. KACC 22063]WDF53919.1 glycosyltransferase family 2 protein [Mucilaginibacter sp. KACC 22063]
MAIKVLIVIPCFNEQASLPTLLNVLYNSLPVENYQIDVLVVNDCSTDETKLIAKKNKVNLIDLPVNLGIGGAVQSGLIYAREHHYDLAIQMDGDGQHPPAELKKLLDCHQKTAANIVIGSRFLNKQGFQSSVLRRIGISYFHWLNKVFTGKSIYDSTSGFRLFDCKALALASKYYPDDYPEPESLVFFSRAGLTIKETAVNMIERQGGKSSIRSFGSLYYCIKVSIAMFFSAIRKI